MAKKFSFSSIINKTEKKELQGDAVKLKPGEALYCKPTQKSISQNPKIKTDVDAKYQCVEDTLEKVANAWKERKSEIIQAGIYGAYERKQKMTEIAIEAVGGQKYSKFFQSGKIESTDLLIPPKQAESSLSKYQSLNETYLKDVIQYPTESELYDVAQILNDAASAAYMNTIQIKEKAYQ